MDISNVSGPDFDVMTRLGKVSTVKDIDKINKNLRNVIKTPVGTRLYSPLYGSKLYLLKYEPINDILMDLVKIYVIDAISTCEPRVKIIEVNVTRQPQSEDPKSRRTLIISVLYEIAEFNLRGTLMEEFLSEGGVS